MQDEPGAGASFSRKMSLKGVVVGGSNLGIEHQDAGWQAAEPGAD
jgi:hypothetical protein